MKNKKIVSVIFSALVLIICFMMVTYASNAPKWVLENMMRTDDTPGIRFCAKVYESLRQDEKLEEYGFIIAACDKLEEKDISVSSFCHESDVTYVSSVNYKASGEDKTDIIFDTEDGIYVIYACSIVNIPEEHYRSGVVAKPYMKYDGEITYGASFRVNYIGAAENMLKSEEFENLSDNEKTLVESIANYGKKEDNEFELEENPDAEGLEPTDVLDEIMTSSLSVAENIIIPTTLEDIETVYIEDLEEYVPFVYAYVDESVKYVPVCLDDCYPAIVKDGKLTEEYDEKLCIYTVDADGLYHIRSLGYAEDENGEYIGLEKEDDGILFDEENENVMFYVDVKENQQLDRVVGNRYDVGFNTRVEFDENTNIVIRHYDSEKDKYEYIIYDCDTIYNVRFNNIDLTYIVSNNPESNSLERCYFVYGMTEEDGIFKTPSVEPEPEDPIVPDEPETVEECNYRIVRDSNPYIDENNYYAINYTLLNTITGKTETVSGSYRSATSSGINNTAVETGSMVALKDGMVDDISGAVTDTLNMVQSPMHEIDNGNAKAGLVWILGYDEETKILSVSDVVVGENWYDITKTEAFKVADNTVVTALEHTKANDLCMWGTFSLLKTEDLSSSKNDYKCYNNRVLADNNNYKTGYAKYTKAYIVTENKQNLEEGERNNVIFAVVVVNDGENFAHLTTNKQS